MIVRAHSESTTYLMKFTEQLVCITSQHGGVTFSCLCDELWTDVGGLCNFSCIVACLVLCIICLHIPCTRCCIIRWRLWDDLLHIACGVSHYQSCG